MDITRDQQIALDDALVAPTNRLTISKITPFYKAFQITTDVPEIYMQEFWATATVHHHSIRFKMNNKKHIVNLEYFREMLQICPKLPDQQFEEPPFEEEILTFLRDLGHSGEIKVITDVNVNKLHQPWRSFAAVINKCLSGKSTGYDTLRLSQAQILWGMYHKKNVDYAYLLWDDFVYQDSSIPRRNRVNWHFARDDLMFTKIKYYAIASGAEPPKTKESVKKKQVGSDKTKTPPTAKGKRLNTSAKAAKPAKKKQLAKTSKAKGLTVLSEVALTEAEQMKMATKISLIQTHSSHASGSGADEGTGGKPGVPDVPTYESDDEQISWKSSDEEDDDDDNDDDEDDADNQDDDEESQDEEDNDEEGSDLRVQTPSHYESINDEESDEVTQGGNVEGEELNKETDKEEEVNELYKDVNVNLEGRDTEMTDAQQTNVHGTHVTEDTHVIMIAAALEVQQQSSCVSSGFISNMLNPNPDTGIDSILNLNTKSTSLVDVPVSTTVEMPHSSATTIPPPPVSLIQTLQQTPISTPTIVPSTSLQNLPTFDSVVKFEDRVKALEDDFSEFKQTNQFPACVSSIPGIVDMYLANKMNEAVKIAVQLRSNRLRDEAQAENADFINKLDDNIKKIIKEQVKAQVTKILPRIEKTINEQLEAEILTRSSNEAKTSHAVAANLSELELKKILIDKMESN
ncbi:retrovirus-related pol polyprotein from transposon TNT 1-94 [Tanacetum coccineum]|uniref:Retrovirus-related pol polyprotein from transposon TNT 1-94 n=1 Tax=Tanacetum coccineum TaxID=301880 RepID=A0ABQ4Y3W8_9ASTR